MEGIIIASAVRTPVGAFGGALEGLSEQQLSAAAMARLGGQALAVVAKRGTLEVGIVVKDGPGFLVNRVNTALRSEVYACLAGGVFP